MLKEITENFPCGTMTFIPGREIGLKFENVNFKTSFFKFQLCRQVVKSPDLFCHSNFLESDL